MINGISKIVENSDSINILKMDSNENLSVNISLVQADAYIDDDFYLKDRNMTVAELKTFIKDKIKPWEKYGASFW